MVAGWWQAGWWQSGGRVYVTGWWQGIRRVVGRWRDKIGSIHRRCQSMLMWSMQQHYFRLNG